MYAVGSRCCWMATSFARGWRFGQRFLARSVLFGLLVCCLATRHRRKADNDNNNSGKINNNKSNTKSATAIELSWIHWSIRLAHAVRDVWRILNCACAALGVGTWRSWGTTVLYAQARSGSKHRPEPDTEPGHYAWHPYSQGIHNYAAKKWNSIEPSLLISPDRTHMNIYVYRYTLSMHIQCLYIVVSLFGMSIIRCIRYSRYVIAP